MNTLANDLSGKTGASKEDIIRMINDKNAKGKAGTAIKGHANGGKAYINEATNKTVGDLVETLSHENAHVDAGGEEAYAHAVADQNKDSLDFYAHLSGNSDTVDTYFNKTHTSGILADTTVMTNNFNFNHRIDKSKGSDLDT